MSLMTLDPSVNLSFNGQCEAAFRYYERCLNGKISFMLTWGDSPMAKDAPPAWSGKIAHATSDAPRIHQVWVSVVSKQRNVGSEVVLDVAAGCAHLLRYQSYKQNRNGKCPYAPTVMPFRDFHFRLPI